MPFFGVGVHILIALFFAVHAVRSGQPLYWLFVLFSFPGLGSLVYFLVIYLPNSRLEYGARKVVAAAAKTLDPTREMRDAQAAFDYTPTAQNQMRLAAAMLENGQAIESAKNYDACLQGPFAADLNIRFNAARAYLACERFAETIEHLKFIRATNGQFKADLVGLMMAQALGGSGDKTAARGEFEAALAQFGSFEIRAEYAIWAASAGDMATAGRLQIELQRSMERWNSHTKELNKPLTRRLQAAFALIKQADSQRPA